MGLNAVTTARPMKKRTPAMNVSMMTCRICVTIALS